jgi:hypothetical protein
MTFSHRRPENRRYVSIIRRARCERIAQDRWAACSDSGCGRRGHDPGGQGCLQSVISALVMVCVTLARANHVWSQQAAAAAIASAVGLGHSG